MERGRGVTTQKPLSCLFCHWLLSIVTLSLLFRCNIESLVSFMHLLRDRMPFRDRMGKFRASLGLQRSDIGVVLPPSPLQHSRLDHSATHYSLCICVPQQRVEMGNVFRRLFGKVRISSSLCISLGLPLSLLSSDKQVFLSLICIDANAECALLVSIRRIS